MDEPPQGSGTYFNGVAAVPRTVVLTVEADAVVIAASDGARLARWPYPAITRLPAPAGRLRLGLADAASTERLEVNDRAFAETVESRLGLGDAQLETSERLRRHRVVEWSVAALVGVILIAVAGMPAIAELLLPFIPRSAEAPFGASAHESTVGGFKGPGPFECGDAGMMESAGKAVFLRLFARMEAAAGLPVTLKPFVVRTKTVNAVAMPGGYVHVYGGIIDQSETPEELAGVIGHELGHVAHRDAMRSLLHTAGLSYLFGVVLGDVVGSGGVVAAAHAVLGRANSRAQEAAADDFGAALLRKLGANPYALADVFERWANNRKPSRDMVILSDHPADRDRVAAIRATPAVDNPVPLLTPFEWQTLKLVCSGH